MLDSPIIEQSGGHKLDCLIHKNLLRVGMAFLRDLWSKKQFIVELGIRDFKSSYFGSIFGLFWAVVEPLSYVSLLYFFIGRVAKYQPSVSDNYLQWLMLGMMVWSFFSGSLMSGMSVYKRYSFLLKRQGLDLSILPLVTLVATSLVHFIFFFLTIVVLCLGNITFHWIWLQFMYYLFCGWALLLGMIWLTASLSVFVKDVENFVGLCVQFGFWASPVFWSLDSFPQKYHFLLKLNPVFYLINGYRDTFIYKIPFWHNSFDLIQYWTITIIVLIVGRYTYGRLRPHFGDVLNG